MRMLSILCWSPPSLSASSHLPPSPLFTRLFYSIRPLLRSLSHSLSYTVVLSYISLISHSRPLYASSPLSPPSYRASGQAETRLDQALQETGDRAQTASQIVVQPASCQLSVTQHGLTAISDRAKSRPPSARVYRSWKQGSKSDVSERMSDMERAEGGRIYMMVLIPFLLCFCFSFHCISSRTAQNPTAHAHFIFRVQLSSRQRATREPTTQTPLPITYTYGLTLRVRTRIYRQTPQ